MFQKKDYKGKELELYKQTLKLTDIQREILIGVLLGDASMSLRDGKPVYSVKFEQGIANKEYIHHLYFLFEPFVGQIPLEYKNKSIWFRTYRHVCFKYYYDTFYFGVNNSKKVPTNIHRLLTPRSLAYWYMDDGSMTQVGGVDTYVHLNLHTQGFDLSDNQLLRDVLKNKFGIIANIHKDKTYYKLYIISESVAAFVKLIKPYILPCFEYKLPIFTVSDDTQG